MKRKGVDLAAGTASRGRWSPRGVGGFGGASRAAPAARLDKRKRRHALTLLISASLLSCRALSKPNAFPPGGDKEAAREAGVCPATRPWARARARFPPAQPCARRAQVAGRGHHALGMGAGGGLRAGGGAGARGRGEDSGAYLETCC